MIKERKEIDKKYKWDLSVIYKDDAAFEADYAVAAEKVEALKQHEATMTQSAENLYNTLADMTEVELLIEKLWEYASLNFSVDTSNNTYQALNTKVRNLAVMAGEATWFVSPYLLKLEQSTVDAWFVSLYIDRLLNHSLSKSSSKCRAIYSLKYSVALSILVSNS